MVTQNNEGCSKRLHIIGANEIAAIYGLPRFSVAYSLEEIFAEKLCIFDSRARINPTHKEIMMAVPSSKSELISDIKNTYKKLKEDFVDIPADLTIKKDMPGHVKDSEMSVCNLLAYLVGWGNLVLKWHRISSQGKMPDLYDTGYKMNELGKLAQRFYKDYEDDNFQTLLDKLDLVVNEILEMIEGMDNNDLYEIEWHGKYPFGRMIQFNTSSPYKNARGRIRKWKKEKGLL